MIFVKEVYRIIPLSFNKLIIPQNGLFLVGIPKDVGQSQSISILLISDKFIVTKEPEMGIIRITLYSNNFILFAFSADKLFEWILPISAWGYLSVTLPVERKILRW